MATRYVMIKEYRAPIIARIISKMSKTLVAQAFQPVQINTLLFPPFQFNYKFQYVVMYFEKFMNKVG
jgi:hypothetical protein